MHRAVHQKRRAFPLLRSGTTLTVAAARGRQQGECKTFAWRAHPNGAARSALAARATPRVPMDPRASLRCSALPQNMKRGSCLRASPSSSIWPPRSATISVVSATLWSLPQPGDRTGGTPEEPRRVATAWSSSARHRSSGCAAPRRRGAFGLGVDLRVQRTRTPPRLRRQTSTTARSPWCGGRLRYRGSVAPTSTGCSGLHAACRSVLVDHRPRSARPTRSADHGSLAGLKPQLRKTEADSDTGSRARR